jgi:hypothetical protein
MLHLDKKTSKYYWNKLEIKTEIAEIIKIYMNFEITFSIVNGEVIIKEYQDYDKELLGWDYSGSTDDAMSV